LKGSGKVRRRTSSSDRGPRR